MSDPLSLLREQFINKKPVSHDATHIFIGDLKFSRNVLTTYKQDRGEWGRGMLAADACIALRFSLLVSECFAALALAAAGWRPARRGQRCRCVCTCIHYS
jgi:hypothetical protein